MTKKKDWFTRQGENRTPTNYEILMEVFKDGKAYHRKQIEGILDGEIPISTLTRLLRNAVEHCDLVKQNGVYSRNAQMLTLYSSEHLSIFDNLTSENSLQDAQLDTQNVAEHQLDKSEVEYF